MRPFLAFAALILASGCRLIPGYEVLRVPADGERFKVGSGWTRGVGPVTPPPADPDGRIFGTARGVRRLSTSADPWRIDVDLKLPFADWLAGALGLRSSDSLSLELGDLTHAFVADATRLPVNQAVLWETVTAKSVVFTIAEDVEVDASALSRQLQGSGLKSARARAHGQGRRTFSVQADAPLVVAIRVVEMSYALNDPAPAAIDLTQAAIGKEQEAPLGYRVRTVSVRPAEKKATLRISSPTVPGGLDEEHTFAGAAPAAWTSPQHGVIPSSADPKARAEDWIVDKVQLVWAADLAQCTVRLTRYYLTVKEVPSGLETK